MDLNDSHLQSIESVKLNPVIYGARCDIDQSIDIPKPNQSPYQLELRVLDDLPYLQKAAAKETDKPLG